MNDTSHLRGITIKVLAIIGFSATVLILIWAVVVGIKNAPSTFAYLASIVRNKDSYHIEEAPSTPEEETEDATEAPQNTKDEVVANTPVTEANPSHTTAQAQVAPTPSVLPAQVVQIPDLKLTVHGIGSFNNGLFYYTSAYSSRRPQVLMIDVENIGTRVSDVWTFGVNVENKNLFASSPQAPLKPGEHAIYTINFTTDERKYADVFASVYTPRDVNTQNNADTYRVIVK